LTNSSSTSFRSCSDDGARLFDDVRDAEVQLEQVRAVEAPGVTHLKYRTVK
jgi:hypothetical protein